MIAAALKDRALLEDIRSANVRDRNFRLWWLGQSGFLLQSDGAHLLLDPYLSDSLTKKYESTDKPHVRMTELPIDPAQLSFVDAITSTHNHTDHLDAETLKPLISSNPSLQLVIPEANRSFVADRLGCNSDWPIGLNDGESAEVGAFRINAVPAAHDALDRDAQGRSLYLGYVVQFGRWTVYHSGDTLLYDGMIETLRSFHVDVALLPINGRAPERRVAGNLSAREAAWVGREMGARLVIPMHYDMFTFNTAPASDFVYAAELERQPYSVLRCGEKWESSILA